jgi:hypothetical protein
MVVAAYDNCAIAGEVNDFIRIQLDAVDFNIVDIGENPG